MKCPLLRIGPQSALTLRSAILARADHEGGRVSQTPSTTDDAQADELRAAMVDRIAALHERLGLVLDAEVRRALLTVPRHLFAECHAELEAAYKDQDAIVTKRNERGIALSSLSAPWLQALMIRQAAVQPGMRVLEIGSGGHHAA